MIKIFETYFSFWISFLKKKTNLFFKKKKMEKVSWVGDQRLVQNHKEYFFDIRPEAFDELCVDPRFKGKRSGEMICVDDNIGSLIGVGKKGNVWYLSSDMPTKIGIHSDVLFLDAKKEISFKHVNAPPTTTALELNHMFLCENFKVFIVDTRPVAFDEIQKQHLFLGRRSGDQIVWKNGDRGVVLGVEYRGFVLVHDLSDNEVVYCKDDVDDFEFFFVKDT
jgi:hypothetical protein